jgi:hypothetical protein
MIMFVKETFNSRGKFNGDLFLAIRNKCGGDKYIIDDEDYLYYVLRIIHFGESVSHLDFHEINIYCSDIYSAYMFSLTKFSHLRPQLFTLQVRVKFKHMVWAPYVINQSNKEDERFVDFCYNSFGRHSLILEV